ncbi:MAG: pyruvate dehydrogenase complex dihydrolipoamide acetyltransferase [Candidatus Dormibacteria bacterium]
MARDILMPRMGYDMTEGTVVRWVKKVGDRVQRGDVVAEIETDKATIEIEAFESGTLLRIVAAPGQTLPVGEPIATLGEPGEELPEVSPAAPASSPPAEAPPPTAPVPVPGVAPRAPAPRRQTAPTPAEAPPVRSPRGPGERPHASPLARRLATSLGLDLGGIVGSGPGGRVVAADVEAAVPDQPAGGSPPVDGPAPGPPTSPLLPPPDGATDVQPSRLRQAIARRMSESKRNAPHFYVAVDCRADALLDLRQALARKKIKVSVNDLLVKALAMAAVEHPEVNVAYIEGAVRSFATVDVGVAIATDQGLLSPAIRDAGTMRLEEVAVATRDLAERARAGRLKPEEYGGGTITLSNLGMYGVDEFLAILNPPQALIVSVGAAAERVIAIKGKPAVARVFTAWAAADHRVLDGAVVGQFMAAFRAIIEDPGRLTA